MSSLWRELGALPLAWTALTVLVFALAQHAFRRSGRRALMNPVLLSVTALCGILVATGTDYDTYFRGAMPIHLMLGPATVALAIPLHQNAGRVRAAAVPVLGALLAGSLTAILVAVGVAYAFGVNETTLLSIAPKSATAPVAIGISEGVGGSATLTAVAVVLTGVGGAVIALPLLNLIRVKDWKAKGFAMGLRRPRNWNGGSDGPRRAGRRLRGARNGHERASYGDSCAAARGALARRFLDHPRTSAASIIKSGGESPPLPAVLQPQPPSSPESPGAASTKAASPPASICGSGPASNEPASGGPASPSGTA